MRHRCGQRTRQGLPAWLPILAAVLWSSLPAHAQPQVETLGRTAHFIFESEPDARPLVESLVDQAEQVRQQICDTLTLPCFQQPVRVRLTRSEEEFRAAQPADAVVDWAVGIAYPRLHRILLLADYRGLFTLEETFAHEVSHIVLHLGLDLRAVPRWFSEGLALYQAGETVHTRIETATAAALTHNLLPLDRLSARFPSGLAAVRLAYAQSLLFFRHMLAQGDMDNVRQLLLTVRRGVVFARAFQQVYGQPLHEMEADWAEDLQSHSSWIPLLTSGALLWFVTTVLFLLSYRRRRRNARRTLARWQEESAEESPLPQ